MAKQTYTTGQVLTAAQMTTLQANDYNWTVSAKTANYVLVAADAGTRITMSSNSGTTITVNTGVFTSGDVVDIVNLGAGVLTVTAGTATVNTSATLALKQYDAGSLWFSATGAAIFFSADAADSPLTTKGDLYTYSTTNDRLAVGNNGETLVADSSASVGLRYSATPSASNPVLNSAMQVWQRGTSVAIAASTGAGSTTFSADRFQTGTGANQAITISRQATGDTTNLPFIQYALRYQRNSGQTGTGALNLAQNFESVNSVPFAGKVVTLSFYARAGANYSAASSALGVILYSATSTDGNVLTGGFTGAATPISSSATLTTTWQRFTFTSTAIASTTTQLAPLFGFTPVGTAGVNDYYEITGVQIDVGSVALPFRTYAATIQGELAACQRYYWRNSGPSGTNYSSYAMGAYGSTVGGYIQIQYPVTMRTQPSSIDFSTLAVQDFGNVAIQPITALTINQPTLMHASLAFTVAFGGTANVPIRVLNNNSTAGYIGLSAEL